jgi:hypothetical protein
MYADNTLVVGSEGVVCRWVRFLLSFPHLPQKPVKLYGDRDSRPERLTPGNVAQSSKRN